MTRCNIQHPATFICSVRQILESLFIERMELNGELFSDYMSRQELQGVVSTWLRSEIYDHPGGAKDSLVYAQR
jgi:type I restriction enzyme R subunit